MILRVWSKDFDRFWSIWAGSTMLPFFSEYATLRQTNILNIQNARLGEVILDKGCCDMDVLSCRETVGRALFI